MSKKQKFQKIIAGVFLLALLVGMLPVASVNAASKPKALPSVSGKSNKTVKIDMTGNGKKNTVKLITTPDPEDNSFAHSFKITVDGKTALSMKNIDKYSAFDITPYYMKLDKNNILLQITFTTYNDYLSYNKIYKYNKKTGKLDAVKSLNDGMSREVVSYTADSITIYNSYQSSLTGWGNWKYTYKYSGGTMKLKSRTADYKCGIGYGQLEDGYDEYFKKGQYLPSRDLTFYTTKDCTEEAFTAHDGDILTVKRIYTNTYSDVRYSFVNSEGVEGWIKVPEDEYDVTSWFYGVINRMAG